MTAQQDLLRNSIKELHITQGISYKHIAKCIGISPCYLSLWLKGDRNFSADTYQVAVEYYGRKD